MNFGLLTQVVLIVITVALGMTYIKPTLEKISVLQDKIFVYDEAIAQTVKLNEELKKLIEEEKQIKPAERSALSRYMPDEVDEVAIMKDLEILVNQSGLLLRSISNDSATGQRNNGRNRIGGEVEEEPLFKSAIFTVNVVGDYTQYKVLLENLTRNDYPLFITSTTVAGQNSNEVLNFTVTVETYSLVSASPEAG